MAGEGIHLLNGLLLGAGETLRLRPRPNINVFNFIFDAMITVELFPEIFIFSKSIWDCMSMLRMFWCFVLVWRY